MAGLVAATIRYKQYAEWLCAKGGIEVARSVDEIERLCVS